MGRKLSGLNLLVAGLVIGTAFGWGLAKRLDSVNNHSNPPVNRVAVDEYKPESKPNLQESQLYPVLDNGAMSIGFPVSDFEKINENGFYFKSKGNIYFGDVYRDKMGKYNFFVAEIPEKK